MKPKVPSPDPRHPLAFPSSGAVAMGLHMGDFSAGPFWQV